MPFQLVLRTSSTLEPQQLFDRSLNIDAHTESMASSDEKAIAGITSGKIALGESVTWRARHFGIWFTMTSKITELVEPQHFVDEQQRGPFKSFRHEHRFETTSEGCLMTDTLWVAAPLGPLGWLAEKLFLKSYLQRLIQIRNEYLIR